MHAWGAVAHWFIRGTPLSESLEIGSTGLAAISSES